MKDLSWEHLLRINVRKRCRALREGKDMEQAFQQKKREKRNCYSGHGKKKAKGKRYSRYDEQDLGL